MKPLVILAGPTAVGKTALSIKLAEKNKRRRYFRGFDAGI